ncbi:MAG: MBL fold metallo-hydrolase [Candidatus Rokubacteria bacterium]|nr:MBL fold metallo-hydrolase [Candidatus Rokubacteria bacterium]
MRRVVTTWCLAVTLSVLSGELSAWAEMAVHFIDVGQGGGVFIQKDGKNILYDCGDTFAGPAVADYLAALDVETIHFLVISHAHKDHMGGCIHVLTKSTVKIKRIFHNGSNAKTGTWRKFLKEAGRADEVVVVERDRDENGIQILVAYDSRGARYSKEADNSVLVRLVDGRVRVLLTGDCEATCEKEVSRTSDVQSDVLNVGHHGSDAASSPEFLKKVKPKIAVIQAGAGNQYNHPKQSVLKRLKQAGVTEIYRTDRHGTVVLHSNGTQVTVETEK